MIPAFYLQTSNFTVQQFTFAWSRALAAFHAVFCKLVNDRAIGAVVPVAVFREVAQRISHFLQLTHLGFQLLDMAKRYLLDVRRCAIAIAPERQQFLDLFNLKTEIAAAADEAQRLNVFCV